MDFQELLRLLYRNKINLILMPLVSAVLAFSLRFFLSDRIFVSESQVSTGLTIANNYLGDESKLSPFKISVSFENLIENMKSKMVVNRIAYKLLYRDLTSEIPFRNPKFSEVNAPQSDTLDMVLVRLNSAIDSYGLINRTTDMGKYIYSLLDEYKYNEKELLTNVEIKRVGSTDFVNTRFSSEVPGLSAFAVNLWADNVVEYYNYQKNKVLNESLEVLVQMLDEKKEILDQNISDLNRYKARYAFQTNKDEADPIGEYERLIREKKSNIRRLNLTLKDVRAQIAQTDKTSSFLGRKKIIGLQNNLDRLSSDLMSDAGNKVLLDSLERLRNELQSEMYLHTSSGVDKRNLDELFANENELKIEYEIALGDLQNLTRQYNTEKGSVINLASAESELNNLEGEVEQSRDQFIIAQDNYNRARSELTSGISRIKLSYYGDAPEDSQSRKTIIFTALGFILGVVTTLFLIVLFDFMDSRIKNPIKFERETGFKPTGCLENLPGLNSDLRTTLIGDFKQLKVESSMIFVHSLQKLRYEIQNLTGKVFLFTSLREGSGKTFLLTSLAYTLSLVQKRILIIDTNFKNNTLSRKLGVSAKSKDGLEGLEKLLKKTEFQKDLIVNASRESYIEKGVITETRNPLVSVMKCGNFSKTPEEIFSIIKFGSVLKNLLKDYDYVFIEGAALNNYSDSKELASYADYIVPVFSVENEFGGKDKIHLDFFEKNKEKVNVNILNKVRKEDVT